MNRVITALVATAVIAVGAVAALDVFEGDSTAAGDRESRREAGSRELVGPHSPEPGALPGTLVVARGEDCVIQTVDLRAMRFSKAGPESGCDFSVSHDGALAAIVAKGGDEQGANRLVELVELDGKPEQTGRIGRLLGDPVWSSTDDGIAACHAPKASETTVVAIDGRPRETVAGCWPAFTTGDGLVTRTVVDLTIELGTDGIYVDGDEVLTLEQLLGAAAAGEDVRGFLLGHTGDADGLIAVLLGYVASGDEPKGSLQLWRDGIAENVIEIPLFVDARGPLDRPLPAAFRDILRFSPGGGELGIMLQNGEGPLFIVDLRTGDVLGPLRQLAYDWSPDGLWLAVASGVGIDVYGPSREDEPTFQIPLATRALAWR